MATNPSPWLFYSFQVVCLVLEQLIQFIKKLRSEDGEYTHCVLTENHLVQVNYCFF